MAANIKFLGGAGTVTGSKYLLEYDGVRILVDCGLFQGLKSLRLKNWNPFPIDPRTISAVILTHAHIDHSGYLPVLVREGFRGPIFCSSATKDLCGILLTDSAHLQEKDAEFANRHGFSKHKPALPLYTIEDASRALEHLRVVSFDKPCQIEHAGSVTFRRAGHILGAASAEISWGGLRIVFSGDLGTYGDPLMFDPVTPEAADYLIVESTYGDRLHEKGNISAELAEVVRRTIQRQGTLIVPAFAVGRAQLILYYLQKLKLSGAIPRDLPMYMDSPMAIDAGEIFQNHPADHKLSLEETRTLFASARYLRDPAASKALTADNTPKIIISASGMATGGRVLHHLKHYVSDARNTVLFVGYQAAATRGAAMMAGAETIKIFGEYIPVRSEVLNLDALSAHADQSELMRWLKGFKTPPKTTFITHGEPVASDALRHRIEEELRWKCVVPDQRDQVTLR